MKKNIYVTLIFCCLLNLANGQTMTQKEARQILEKSIHFLKSSDTASFINLWQLDDSAWPYHKKAFTNQDVKENFMMLKTFLDTALTKNLKIDEIEIEKYDPKKKEEFLGDYNIKAWFKYNKHYYKGLGFNVVFRENRWFIRYSPDTSVRRISVKRIN